MSSLTGNIIFYGAAGISGLMVFLGLLWAFLLGMWKNRKSSGKSDVFSSSYTIRGTVDDTLTQIEKGVRELYRQPMEIERRENKVTFFRILRQNIISTFRQPFEYITFTADERPGNLINITYTVSMKTLRRAVMLISILLFTFLTMPAVWYIIESIREYYMPAFLTQGDIIPEVAYTRKGVLYIFNVVHFIWPPFIPLFIFHGTTMKVKKEFTRFLRNIEFIE